MVVLVKQNFMDSQVVYTPIDYSILLFSIDLFRGLWSLNFLV